jgi:hypothetical protein
MLLHIQGYGDGGLMATLGGSTPVKVKDPGLTSHVFEQFKSHVTSIYISSWILSTIEQNLFAYDIHLLEVVLRKITVSSCVEEANMK